MHPTGSRRMSVFTAVALGLSAIAITCIVSGSVIVLYGMRIVDKKADTVPETVEALLGQLPAIRAALPPVLTDALEDERRPDYVDQLDIDVQVQPDRHRSRRARTSIAVVNNGEEVVSMLALRVVALDDSGQPISTATEYVATPLAIDDDWRGPLMPGSKRRALRSQYSSRQASSVEYEVTELRVWRPGATDPAPEWAASEESTGDTITRVAETQ